MAIRNHLTGEIDTRYTVTKERPAYEPEKYITRYKGKRIASGLTPKEAWELAQEHYDNHKICAVEGYHCGEC